jgi:hypothetical protein
MEKEIMCVVGGGGNTLEWKNGKVDELYSKVIRLVH